MRSPEYEAVEVNGKKNLPVSFRIGCGLLHVFVSGKL